MSQPSFSLEHLLQVPPGQVFKKIQAAKKARERLQEKFQDVNQTSYLISVKEISANRLYPLAVSLKI